MKRLLLFVLAAVLAIPLGIGTGGAVGKNPEPEITLFYRGGGAAGGSTARTPLPVSF